MRLKINKVDSGNLSIEKYGEASNGISILQYDPNVFAYVCPNCTSELYAYLTLGDLRSAFLNYNSNLYHSGNKHQPNCDKIGKFNVPEELRNYNEEDFNAFIKKHEEDYKTIKHDLMPEIKKINEEVTTFKNALLDNSVNCPICGSALSKNYGYYLAFTQESKLTKLKTKEVKLKALEDCTMDIENIEEIFDNKRSIYSLTEKDFDGIFSYMRSIRIQACNKEAENKVLEFVNSVASEYIPESSKTNTGNFNLKEYLKNLISLECNIYSLTKRLKLLYQHKIENDRQVEGERLYESFEKKYTLDNAKKNYTKQLKEFETIQLQLDSAILTGIPFAKEMPKEPDKPQIPEYGVPGVFNKKKVLMENEMLKQKYEDQLLLYNQEILKYNQLLQLWHDEKREYEKAEMAKARTIQETQLETCKERLSKASSELEKAQVQYDKYMNESDEAKPTPGRAYKMVLDEEITLAEKTYDELYKCKENLYNVNVVFGKYRNLPAITTFYEYLMSGRCESLEGVNGAYNIYEQELRANIIIDKLDDIIVSLEELKQNQYVICSEMQNINATLNLMEANLALATDAIVHIEENVEDMSAFMEHISKNTDVIAYNTTKTAYYSKLNAELTNALGYMVALS